MAVLKTHVIKSPNLMGWLYWRFAAINAENRGNEFNRQYLSCQISTILYADRGDRRKSQSPHRAHLAIFADRGDGRIKSPGVSPALGWKSNCTNTPLSSKFIITTGTTNTPLSPKFIIILDALNPVTKSDMFSKGVMFYFVYSSFA